MRAQRDVPGCQETRAYLGKHGVDLTGEQQTKTKTALEFFAGESADTAAT
jgi:hypothetical protein